MWPILFEIPGTPIRLHSFGLMVALGFIAANTWAVRRAAREGLDGTFIGNLTVWLLLSGLAGARLFYILLNWSHFQGSLLAFFKIWEGGLVFYGGPIVAFPVGYWYVTRRIRPDWRIADILVTSVFLALSIGRIGCLLAGDDFGKITDVPWAIHFPDNPDSLIPRELIGKPLHPTQIYLSLNAMALFLIGRALLSRRRFPGQVAGILGILYAFTRSAIELVRGDVERGIFLGISTSQWVSIPILLASIGLLLWRSRHKEPPDAVPAGAHGGRSSRQHR